MAKDFQRNKIYTAENQWEKAHQEEVLSRDEMQVWLNRLVKRVQFQKLQTKNVVKLTCDLGSNCLPCRGDNGEWLLDAMRTSATVGAFQVPHTKMRALHSLAHLIDSEHAAFRTYSVEWRAGQIHHPGFVKIFLDLVRRFYCDVQDPGVAQEFKRYLLNNKVKTSTKSPEAREAAKERYRQKKVVSIREEIAAMLRELNGE
jgi:hypothetical protein